MGKNKKYRIAVVLVFALLIKLVFFIFSVCYAPAAKYEADTRSYLDSGIMLVSKGIFGVPHKSNSTSQPFRYEVFRTPGYPLFLGICLIFFHCSLDHILLIQLLISLLMALILYYIVCKINEKIAFLSYCIIAFDPSITVFSLRVLSELLFSFLLVLFLGGFIRYIKDKTYPWLCFCAITLVAATYVRPIAYYLGIVIAGFIGYMHWPEKSKKLVMHVLSFLLIVYSLLGVWQLRNFVRAETGEFSTVQSCNFHRYSIFYYYKQAKNKNLQSTQAIIYYPVLILKSLRNLLVQPVSLKYLGSLRLKQAGKIFCYPWITFWFLGFCWGIRYIRGNIYYEAIACILLYFIVVTVVGAAFCDDVRFRIPLMPFLAILSSLGWYHLKNEYVALKS